MVQDNSGESSEVHSASRVFQDPMKGTAPDMEIAENLAIASKRGLKRQALTLLMASMCKPKLLLLDEHTAALDPKTACTDQR